MAEGRTLIVEQSLHGYSKGHKQLSSSIDLDPQSRATMLIHSDLLVSSSRPNEGSYLTGYPLKTAQRYVFAKTWMAGEGVRPGSVWTHSLILDLQTLTLLDDLSCLQTLFAFPDPHTHIDYTRSLEINNRREYSAIEQFFDDERASMALHQLYGSNLEQEIIVPDRDAGNEQLAIALWRQMWPAMRREFAFITGRTSKKPKFEAECALFFLKGYDDLSLSKSPEFESHDGFDLLLSDLWKPGPTKLRSFIGRYAIEGTFPRQLAPSLAELCNLQGTGSLGSRMETLRQLSGQAKLPRLIRDMLVQELVNAQEQSDLEALVKEYRHEPVDDSLRVGLLPLLAREDLQLIPLLLSTDSVPVGELGQLLFSSFVMSADADVLASAASAGVDRLSLLRERPEVIEIKEFWPKSDASRAELIQKSQLSITLAMALQLFSSSIGPKTALAVLEGKDTPATPHLLHLLRISSEETQMVAAEWIIQAEGRMRNLAKPAITLTPKQLEILCQTFIERRTEIHFADIWGRIILMCFASSDHVLRPSTLIIAFAAALSLESKQAVILAELVFDDLHELARKYRLSVEQRRFLLSSLPATSKSWSLERSLSRAVVEKWHVRTIDQKALAISRKAQPTREIVEELISKFDRSAIEATMRDKRTPLPVLNTLKQLVRPKRKKSKPLWWLDW